MLDQHGGLDVAVLIFYSILIFPAVYVCKRQGFRLHAGWLYLVTLPLVRIIGAACYVAALQSPSTALFTTAAICNGIGLVPLLLALMGLMKRVYVDVQFWSPITNQFSSNEGMQMPFPQRIFLVAHLIILVGLALSIAGGVEAIPGNSAKEIAAGITLRKAASILLLVAFFALAAAAARAFKMIKQTWTGDRMIVYAALISLPFLLVRALYYVALTFDTRSVIFNAYKPNVFVQAFMQVLMEFIVFGLFLAVGLNSPTMKEAPHAPKEASEFPPKRYSQLEHNEGAFGEAEMGSMRYARAA
jgi:hypothetical protein